MGLGLAFISFTFSPPRYNPIQLSKSRLVTGSSPIHPFVTFTPDNYAGITLPIQFDASIVGSIPFKQSSSKQTFPFFYITCLGSVSVRSKGTTINGKRDRDSQMTWNALNLLRVPQLFHEFQYNAAIEFSIAMQPSLQSSTSFIRARNVIRTSSP